MAQSIKLGNDTFLSIAGLDGWVKDQLPANANANSYTSTHQQGWYYVGDASSMSNVPASWGFFLVLVYGSIITQVFVPYTGTGIKIRGSNGGSTWGSWNSVTLS